MVEEDEADEEEGEDEDDGLAHDDERFDLKPVFPILSYVSLPMTATYFLSTSTRRLAW